MKKIKLTLVVFAAIFLTSLQLRAQVTPAQFYAGKWDVLVKGIPQGDTHMIFTLVEKDGKLSGVMQDPETKKEIPLTNVEKDDKGITMYFTAQGYDVNIALQKKDEDHLTGSLLSMFECTGERVK